MSGPGRPSRLTVYRQLDRAVAELENVGGLPLPAEAEGIWEGIWVEETHNSTAIEGNTLVQRQVQLLLEEGRAVGSKKLAEYLEVQSYGEAALWVYRQAHRSDRDWSDDSILHLSEVREIHERVIATVWRHAPPERLHDQEGPGSFRRHDIQPFSSGMRPPAWPDVPQLMHNWVAAANDPPAERSAHLMEHLAGLHAAFERIHPFRDGNGRVGRLLLNVLLVRHGYPPAIVYKRDRAKYLRALARSDKGDDGPLAELFARSVKHSIDRFLLPGLAGPHRMVPLTALADAELSHNALHTAAKRGRLRAQRQRDQWYSTKQWVDEYKRSRYRRR
jgi:Fic family protein